MKYPKIQEFDPQKTHSSKLLVNSGPPKCPYEVREKTHENTGEKYNVLCFNGEEMPCRKIVVDDEVGCLRTVTVTVSIY